MGLEQNISRNLVQTAVYWGNPVNDGFSSFTFDDPIEILCRWQDRLDISAKVYDRFGDVIECNAVVFVDQDLDEQGYLFLGNLVDIDSGLLSNPESIITAYSIKRFDKVPMLKSKTRFYRRAFLGFRIT